MAELKAGMEVIVGGRLYVLVRPHTYCPGDWWGRRGKTETRLSAQELAKATEAKPASPAKPAFDAEAFKKTMDAHMAQVDAAIEAAWKAGHRPSEPWDSRNAVAWGEHDRRTKGDD